MLVRRLALVLCLLFCWTASAQTVAPKSETLKGWISDEQCARSQARQGVYKGTNPDCVRDCVARGKKVVLIDPTGKRILVIANPDAAMTNLGDYVEIKGAVNAEAGTLQIDSIQLLKKGKSSNKSGSGD